MSVLKIVEYPDPLLTLKCSPVTEFDNTLHTLINDMVDTMNAYNGIGLAAPQVGILKQLFIINYNGRSLTLINPKIITKKGQSRMEEGCLSIPGVLVNVERAAEVEVEAVNQYNIPIHLHEKEMIATIIQHEYDHLEGILITDKGPSIPIEE